MSEFEQQAPQHEAGQTEVQEATNQTLPVVARPSAHLVQRVKSNPHLLSPGDVLSLQRTIGNRAVTGLIRGKGQLQRDLENESLNQQFPDQPHVIQYAKALNDAVQQAHSMIITKYFVHIPASDNYMQALVDNFDKTTNKFKDGSRVPRQAGYWIESYATKIANPAVGGGLDRLLQAKRGNSRPDVILQKAGHDLAWLDITSSKSADHIFGKNSSGWMSTPYVTEVTYPPITVHQLNSVAVPNSANFNISALIDKANEALKQTLNWEQAVIEKYGSRFAYTLNTIYNIVKGRAVKAADDESMDEDEHDELYASHMPGNEFERLSTNAISDLVGQPVEPYEAAAAVMYMQSAIARYEKRFEAQLPGNYKLVTKKHLGLEWIKDVSSADGEPVIRSWFKV